MLSSNRYSINNDEAETPLIGSMQVNEGTLTNVKKKSRSIKDITRTTAFQTIISVVITIIILVGMIGLVVGASMREDLVSYNVYDLVKVDNIKSHLTKLNKIATEHRGNRDVLDGGFNASVDYVVSQLSRYKNVFDITIQNFTSTILELEETPVLNIVSPETLAFVHKTDFSFHPSFEGEVEGDVAYAGDGCNAKLYTPFTIAIVSDGNCSIYDKIDYASK